jgi:uncharacterized protein YdiU (UPF0061 family)
MSFTVPPTDAAALRARIVQDLPNSFASLGQAFFSRLPATPIPSPYLVGFSAATAQLLGWPVEAGNLAADPAWIDYCAGNLSRDLPAEALPIATVYSGHQFGVWAGQLGDGRALTLGEIEQHGTRLEVQLKGAGLTPYSRMGDGRAVLRSSIREFLASEALHALGVPTTRALCVIGSDLPIRRESVETAAVVTRIAPSFVRFGHFEHFYARKRPDLLQQLADHVIERLYPLCRDASDPYLALLEVVTLRTAELMAQWQAVGFCHGVMNTDNMSVAGLTIDYGPYGFLDGFDAGHICNHTDSSGRYAYDQQPQIAYWNLFCLAQAVLPLIGAKAGQLRDAEDSQASEAAIAAAQSALEPFIAHYTSQYQGRLRAKFGLATQQDGDEALMQRLFGLMQAAHADFTLTFRRLSQVARHAGGDPALDNGPVRDLFPDRPGFDAWAADYRARLHGETLSDVERAAAMNQVNPKYILRNHLAENAIRQAQNKDFAEVERLLQVLRHPFAEQSDAEAAYGGLPPDWAQALEVSCSS